LVPVLLLAATPLRGQETITTSMDSIIQRIVPLTIEQKYDSALGMCALLQEMPGGLAYAMFLKAAVLQSRMLDYENDAGKDEFFDASKQARELFQKSLRKSPRSAISHFFIGATYAYESFYFGKKDRLIDAFRTGWLCLQELEAALDLDDKLYDAYVGIGTFRYYQAKLGKNFTWLPFVEDKRDDAIAMIRKAIYHGKYSREAAINGLSWILMEEHREVEALALIDSALVEYPHSRFFMWGAGAANFRLERWSEAERYYKLILETFEEDNHSSPYNELVCHLKLAEIHLQQSNPTACREQLAAFHAVPINGDQRERGEKLFKRARDLEKAANGD
jgi:tetratricopeptide (TPR) repeat protein